MINRKKTFLLYLVKTLGVGIALLLVFLPVTFAGIYLLEKSGIELPSISVKFKNFLTVLQAEDIPPLRFAENYSDESNPNLNDSFELSLDSQSIYISSTQQLIEEVKKVNESVGSVIFVLDDGVYTLNSTIDVTADNIAFVSRFRDPADVVIQGGENLQATVVGNLFRVTGKNFTLDGITLQNAKNHLIQIVGEQNADFPVIQNCILQDSYQQLIKVSYDSKLSPQNSADFGLIQNCSFQYTAGNGPQYYIGGIDAHAVNGWIIRDNKFKDISSPSEYIAEYAIHLWNNSNNNLVENNIIEDCDRGIGFGMYASNTLPNIEYANRGGIIRNNLIIHSDNGDPFADSGIVIEDSAFTLIENNKIWLEHDYPRAIEYRFPTTTGVVIRGNITNKKISSRDGGSAKVINNITNADLSDILAGM